MTHVLPSGIQSGLRIPHTLTSAASTAVTTHVCLAEFDRAPVRLADIIGHTVKDHTRNTTGDVAPRCHPLAIWIEDKARAKGLVRPERAAPDMYSVSFSLPVGGPVFGVAVTLSADYLGNLYGGLNMSAGLSLSPPVSVSAAWVGQGRKPGEVTMRKAQGGFSANVHAGAIFNGSRSLTGGKQVTSVTSGAGLGVSAGFGIPLGKLGSKPDDPA